MIVIEGIIVPNEETPKNYKEEGKRGVFVKSGAFSHFSKNYFNMGLYKNTFSILSKSPHFCPNRPTFQFPKKKHTKSTHEYFTQIYFKQQ